MKYLKLFYNFDEFDAFIDEKNFEVPCVGYVEDENYVHYFKDYEKLPTNLIVGESYPNVVAFFQKIIAELDLNFDTNGYYSIGLQGDYSLSNEINVTGYEWYDYLLNLQIGNINSETGEFMGSSIPWIKIYIGSAHIQGGYILDFTTNDLSQVPI